MSSSSLLNMFDPALRDAFRSVDPWPQSHHDMIEHYYNQYDKQITSGEYIPFIYPWGTYGALVVIVYLCIPHQNRPWLKQCRFLAFAWIAAFAAYTIFYTRAKGMAQAFGIGLASSWSVAWIGAILLCNDAQTDFQRIERLEGAFGRPDGVEQSETNDEKQRDGKDESKTKQNGIVKGENGPRNRHGEFAWQPYPLSPFIERLDWVLDIFCNFRGAGWNWRTSALPPPPKEIQEQLQRNSTPPLPKTSNRIHSHQVKLHTSRQALLRANMKTLIKGYIVLDILKTIMMHDRYFWGLIDASPPTYPPFSYLPQSPKTYTHMYRLTLSMLAVKYALQTIFSLGPLFFAGILGPKLLGARAEHWMYPDPWGGYNIVLDKGIAGWWSNWWHQTFRFAFEQPSLRIVEACGLDRKSPLAKVVQLGVAFGLSGVLHASGSYTCPGKTYPITSSMAFFLWQAVGVLAEVSISQTLKPLGMQRRVPKMLMQAFTFVYVHVWFYFTAHLLCDDFARGGVWLFEPIPVSPLRGLGFGADPRDSWWCWGKGEVFSWHRGNSWWTSGLAF